MDTRTATDVEAEKNRHARDLANSRLILLQSKLSSLILEHAEALNQYYPELFRFIDTLCQPDPDLHPIHHIHRILLELGPALIILEKRTSGIKKFYTELFNAFFDMINAEFEAINLETSAQLILDKPQSASLNQQMIDAALSDLSSHLLVPKNEFRNSDTLTIKDISRFLARLNACIDFYCIHNNVYMKHQEGFYLSLKQVAETQLDEMKKPVQQFYDILRKFHEKVFVEPKPAGHTRQLFLHLIFNEIARIKECKLEHSETLNPAIAGVAGVDQLYENLSFGKDLMKRAQKWEVSLQEPGLQNNIAYLDYCDTEAKLISDDIASLHMHRWLLNSHNRFKQLLTRPSFDAEKDNFTDFQTEILKQFAVVKEKLAFWSPRNLLIATMEGFLQAYSDPDKFNSHDVGIQDEATDIFKNLKKTIDLYVELTDLIEKDLGEYLEKTRKELEDAYDSTGKSYVTFTLPAPLKLEATLSLTERASSRYREDSSHILERMSDLNNANNHYSFSRLKKKRKYVSGYRGLVLPADTKEIIDRCNRLGEAAFPPKKPTVLASPSGVRFAENHKKETAVDPRTPNTPDPVDSRGNSPRSTGDMQRALSGSPIISRSPSPRRRAPNSVPDLKLQFRFNLPTLQEWSRAKKILVAIGISLVIAAAVTGLVAGLLYAGPLVAVAGAAGAVMAVQWGAAIGTVGVLSILVGIPAVGVLVGLVAGLIWGRRGQNNAPQMAAAQQPAPAYTPIASSPEERSPAVSPQVRRGSSPRFMAPAEQEKDKGSPTSPRSTVSPGGQSPRK